MRLEKRGPSWVVWYVWGRVQSGEMGLGPFLFNFFFPFAWRGTACVQKGRDFQVQSASRVSDQAGKVGGV